MVHSINVSDEAKKKFKAATAADATLSTLKQTVLEGWPSTKAKVPQLIKRYFNVRADIYLDDELLFLNERVIVPEALQAEMLQLIHTPHLGIEKSKSRARQLIYWPGMSEDIERMVAACKICQRHRASNQKEPMMAHETPSLPFQRIGMDLFEIEKHNFAVLGDYYSRYIEIIPMRGKATSEIVNKIKPIFATHGLPRTIVADNMPFTSHEFKKFCSENDIELVTSSPRYPQSNGFAERAVQTAKRIIIKAKESNSEWWPALLEYRNTPLSDTKLSPNQMLMSRHTRTPIPAHNSIFAPQANSNAHDSIRAGKRKQQIYYDQKAKHKEDFVPGQSVWYQLEDKTWVPARIASKHSTPRSYLVELEDGRVLRRNSKWLRTRHN